MKPLALIVLLCLTFTVAACGNEDSSIESKNTDAVSADAGKPQAEADSGEPAAVDAKPRIEPPKGSPPKELVVEELEEGTGPPAKEGDELAVRFVAVNQAGDVVYDNWGEKTPFTYELGSGEYGSGWDEGLTGAKAGGRRELSIPADEAYGKKRPLFYVVEVIEVKPPSSKDVAGQADGASPAR